MTIEEIDKRVAELEKERTQPKKEPESTYADKREREPKRVEEK